MSTLLATLLSSLLVSQQEDPSRRTDEESTRKSKGDALSTGAVRRVGSVRFGCGVRSVCFSPDGRRLALGSDAIRLYNSDTGKEVFVFRGNTRDARSLTFSRDGTVLSYITGEKTIALSDMETGSEFLSLNPHQTRISASALSPDGKTLASGARERTIRLWDTRTGRKVTELGNRDEREWIWSLAWSPDGRKLASGSATGRVRIWKAEGGDQLVELRAPHRYYGSIVSFSPDGRTLASASMMKEGSVLHLWDLKERQLVFAVYGGGQIGALSFSPDGTMLATGGEDRTIRLWEIATGHELLRLSGHAGSISSLSFAPNGHTVVSGSADGTAILWNLSPRARFKKEGLPNLWRELKGDGCPEVYQAIVTLAAGEKRTLEFLHERLKLPQGNATIRKWVESLESDSVELRETGDNALRRLGMEAALALKRALKDTDSSEVRARIKAILAPLEVPLLRSPELIRRTRAIQVLERIDDARARELLSILAEESPVERERRQARGALLRVIRRQARNSY